ncbi:MAG TPA: Gfo/Idh/MocA family oxidoreductase [Kofleriaceae bacterium]|nr:Gfo/Idh/MocA family oxidoreductase [Kofleriaceae bacterium]
MGVIGLGHFAQAAILPAFRYLDDVELTALVSGSTKKRDALRDRYEVEHAVDYDALDELLDLDRVDAVYIALPPDMHAEYAIKCARRGVHVLCEKPMAPSEEDCRAMIAACEAARVRLMIAYRLHFEAANLTAIDLAQGGKLGEPRFFVSSFSQQVREHNIRVQPRPGAGPLFDMGIYCINAARYLFRDEPYEVIAAAATNQLDARFKHADEAVAATLRFPNGKLASFVTSFGAHDRAHYEVVCTEGVLSLDQSYEYAADMKLTVENGVGPRQRTFHKRDQIAAEIEYFVKCVREGIDPEPSGYEGLADIRIIEAINRAVRTGRAEAIEPIERPRRPDLDQEIRVPPHGPPRLVEVESASQ